ncbi:HAD-IIIC family phosphatase [Catelliglobosispora koreensis]|uniref:HAD-IIIC family phosphatase n=1 Tax=Catelliglobosispora koreensis TaxID=129052 RepID=UPI00037C6AE3|nr:HAD-IIIC family phosphatase [Catelliglobosispora koreensis]
MSKDSLSLVIAASFTAEPLTAGFAHWGAQLGIQIDVAYCPFGQVFQSLLDPASAVNRNTSGINVLLIQEVTAELSAAITAAAQSNPAPLLVAVCPPEVADLGVTEPNVYAVAVHEWYPVADYADDFAAHLGGVPYTPAFFAALSTAVIRTAEAIRTPRPKVIVADADNTLWDGTVGEDGPGAVAIRRDVMEFLVAQQAAGRLICLASRNHEDDVFAVLSRADSPLKREHLAAWRIDWNAKSTNIRGLAAELGVGLDSFVFIDDNPVECAQVRADCPEVLTLHLPADASEAYQFLRHIWPLDILRVTGDDRLRTLRYQQERDRRDFQASAPTLEEFLAGLELDVNIEPLSPADWERAAQLSQRTNQFNINGIRLSATVFAEGNWLTVRVSDRFGDYGLTGLLGHSTVDGVLEVSAFMLSCRVLGRGVEHRILNYLSGLGPETIAFCFADTERNQPARDFFTTFGGYAIAAAIARAARPRTASLPPVAAAGTAAAGTAATGTAATGTAATGAAATGVGPAAPSQTYAELVTAIAANYATPAQLLAAITAAPQEVSAEATPLEAKVIQLWAELLGKAPANVTDNFFALGGQSLQVVQFMARVRQVFGVELPVDLLFTPAFTVAEVSAAILELQVSDSAALLEEIESLSDDEIEALLAAEETGR